ncbi:GntR family transcriptional regulator [Humibacter albus]|uniref:GntR family transcriptional regulator n=1 Tax=Humibacter albus TaxID=427754 RepID=UPI0003B53C2E|nr:GntR family transcriptional regulator [Humibacter albus]
MTKREGGFDPLPPAASLREGVESTLSAAIVSGELAPGTLVSVPTLAAQFSVSATPVREAMLDLEKRGFVRSVRNKGFRVTEVSESELRNLVQVRRWLEGPAMRIVAERIHDGPIAELREIAHEITVTAGKSEFTAYLAADSRFHLGLLRLTGNDRLVDMVAELRKQTRLVGLVSMSQTAELQESAAEHDELLDLLLAGRGEDAERLMMHHIGHVVGWWAGRREEELAAQG